MMKFYIFISLLFCNMSFVLGKAAIRKQFLKWEKSLTQSEKDSLKDILIEYNQAYKKKDTKMISYLEPALQEIMNNWYSLYQSISQAQDFFKKSSSYVQMHPHDPTVKLYLTAYKNYDQMPTDKNRHNNLLKMQNKLQSAMKS